MLNGISWSSYLYFITVLCLPYYAIVIGFLYRSELKDLWAIKLGHVSTKIDKAESEADNASLQYVLDEAAAFCNQINQYDYEHSDLLLGLKKIVEKHSNINTDGNQESKGMLQLELEKRCSIYLSPAEMDWLWSGVK